MLSIMVALLLSQVAPYNTPMPPHGTPVGGKSTVTGNMLPLSVDGTTGALSVSPSTVATALNVGTCIPVAGSTTILAANAARKVAVIVNTGTAIVYFKLGATAAATNPPLLPQQSFTIDGPTVYTGIVDAIAASGTQNVCVFSW